MNRSKRLSTIATSTLVAAGALGAIVVSAPAASAASSCGGSQIDSRPIKNTLGTQIGTARLYYRASDTSNCTLVTGPAGATKIAKLVVGDSANPATAGPGQFHRGQPATGNFGAGGVCVKFGGEISGPGGNVGSTMTVWVHCG